MQYLWMCWVCSRDVTQCLWLTQRWWKVQHCWIWDARTAAIRQRTFIQFHQPLNPRQPKKEGYAVGEAKKERETESPTDGFSSSLISLGFVFGHREFISRKHSGRRERSLGHPLGSYFEWIQTVPLRTKLFLLHPPQFIFMLSLLNTQRSLSASHSWLHPPSASF